MSGAIDTVGDVVGSVLDTAGDIVSEGADFVGDVVSEIDFEDALQTYIQTGSVEAAIWAATPGDEKIGYDYGVKGGSDNDSGSQPQPTYTFEETADQPFQVSFMPGEQGGVPDDVTIGGVPKGIYDAFGNIATNIIQDLKSKSDADNSQAQIYGDSSRQLVNSFSGILADVASGKYSKSPASEYNTRSVLDAYSNQNIESSLSAGLLSNYNEAKKKVAEYTSTPSSVYGELALQGNPFYNFMQQRKIGQSTLPPQGLFDTYLQEKGIV